MSAFLYTRHLTIILCLMALTRGLSAYADTCSPCGDNETCSPCEPVACNSGFLQVDLLYWRAFESGFNICVPREVSDSVVSNERVVSTFSGKDRYPRFRWNPAFRVGAGYGWGNNGWDIAAYWTHFHSHAHHSGDNASSIRWNLNFDVIDLIAGYPSNLGSCFVLKPFGGLRGAKINQKLHVEEFTSSTGSSLSNDLFTTTNKKNREKFSGIGPLIGLEADWNLNCGFSLYTSASISWLYGRFDVRLFELEESETALNVNKLRQHPDASLAVADIELGIRWQKCFCSNTRLVLQLGLEHHRYFDYNRIGGYGDLSFDGVNFSAGIHF